MPSNALIYARTYLLLTLQKLCFFKRFFSLALWSTLSTVTIAAFAVKVSIDQLDANNTTSAKGIYKDYLGLALANPKYAGASNPLSDPRYNHFKSGSDEREAYEFFMSLLLNSVDEIMSTSEKKHWRKTLIWQISYHALYLNTGEFGPASYLCETRDLIALGIEEYAKRQRESGLDLEPITLDERVLCSDAERRAEEAE